MIITKHKRSSLSALMLCAGAAACGGGGSDSGSGASTAQTPAPAPVSSPAPAPAPSPAPSPAPAPASVGSTCGIGDFQSTILARLNQLRAAGASCGSAGAFAPAAALTWSAQLTQAAEAHSQDMVANNYFSHTGSDGSSMTTRVNATGYAWTRLGENIAAGYSGIDAVLAGWMTSDGHCANIMDSRFNQVGLVCVSGTSSTMYGSYWTMDVATSR